MTDAKRSYKPMVLGVSSLVFVALSVRCSPDVEAPVCGDGLVNQDHEMCDDDAIRGDVSCRDYGFVRGELSCDSTCNVGTFACESETSGVAVCGNGMLENGEECDIVLPAGLDCERLDLGVGELLCTSNCVIDTSQCSDVGSEPTCGNGQCSLGENCESCEEDCGDCLPGCGDSQCGGSETCGSCPQDCGSCLPDCPDGLCNGSENCNSCPQDCGTCGGTCGDGTCSEGETCEACSQDCGQCLPTCGDGSCNGNETCNSCVADCGQCLPTCGDGSCNGNETCNSCVADCGQCLPTCGDGSCNGNETCNSCAQDCGQCPPECGDGECNGNETCNSCQQDCGACPCQAADYWGPTLDSETDSTGLQWNQSINVSIKVEVRQANSGLEVRACKPGGTFSDNVAFHIYDGASSKGWVQVANLATANSQCSAWTGLSNDTGYLEGQQFGGIWQLVSPASSANDWGWPASSCSVFGNPTGTCWNGVNITLTRTCK